MKKLLVVILSFFVSMNCVLAQTLLRVRLADDSRFNISVNGRHFNKQGTSITVGDLPPGKHFLKIYSVAYDRWGSAYDRVIYQGSVVTNYRMITQFVYDPYTRRVNIKDIPSGENGGPVPDYQNPDNNQYRAYYDNGSGKKYSQKEQDNSDNSAPPVANDAGNSASGVPAASPVPAGTFADTELEKLKARTDAKNTDTDKLKLVKEALKKETVTTFQVSAIMDWFLFESTKLEFAKWAYNITTDQDFYGDLSSKFDYKSSKEELEQFIKSRR